MTRLLTSLIFLFFLPAAGYPADFYVNGTTGNDSNSCNHADQPCKTIKAALDKAPVGHHTIRVTRGTYTEDSMTLADHRFITIRGGYSDNFTQQIKDPATTFIKGIAQSTSEYLFSVDIKGSGNQGALTLQYLTFTQGGSNTIDEAIEFRSSDSAQAWLTIDQCVFAQFSKIVQNSLGIIVAGSSVNGEISVTITDSYFKKNTAETIIYTYSALNGSTTTTTIRKCRFLENGNNLSNIIPISLRARGSGITRTTIKNTIIADNKVRGGRAINLYAANSASIFLQSTNTTIFNNSSLWPDHESGLYAEGHDSSKFFINFTNSIIYRNNAKDIVFNMQDSAALNFTSDYGILGDKHIIGNVQYTSTNEVHGDPLLDSRYHLKKGSPAIDAGICGQWDFSNPLAPTYNRIAPYDDIDGDKRPGFGKIFGCDIGADEYKPFSWPMFLPAIIHPRLNSYTIPTTPHF